MRMRSLLSFVALAAMPALLFGAETKERYDRTWDFQPGTRLQLKNENGSVTVRTWDRDAARIIAEKRVRTSDGERARQTLREIEVKVHAEGRTLVVETETPDHGANGFFEWLAGKGVDVTVDYELYVPKSLSLDVATVNGRIALDGVDGTLVASTTNGRIDVTNAGGTLQASTTNGGIHAELERVAGASEFSTTNGSIELAVPATLRADLHAETTNGAIDSELPVLTQHGDSNELDGAINGGGPKLHLETTNGGIRIRKTT